MPNSGAPDNLDDGDDDGVPELIPLDDSSDDEDPPTLPYHAPQIIPPSRSALTSFRCNVFDDLATVQPRPKRQADTVFAPNIAVERWITRHRLDLCAVVFDVSAYFKANQPDVVSRVAKAHRADEAPAVETRPLSAPPLHARARL